MNVRLRMYKYCYSNLGTIYAKRLYGLATARPERKAKSKCGGGRLKSKKIIFESNLPRF